MFQNIEKFGYRRDLLRFDEVGVEEQDAHLLPRYILAHDEQFFKMAFQLLDRKGRVATETWRLVSRLPISPDI